MLFPLLHGKVGEERDSRKCLMTSGNRIKIIAMRYWLKKTMLNKYLLALDVVSFLSVMGLNVQALFSLGKKRNAVTDNSTHIYHYKLLTFDCVMMYVGM